MTTVAFPTPTPHAPHIRTNNIIPGNAFDDSPCTKAGFAFASIKGQVCLIQMSLADYETTSSALTIVDVNVFKHEFITIFRWSHQTTVHPGDIRIIEPIGEGCVRYEEENGTVFLAKDVMERLRKVLSDRKGSIQRQRLPRSIRR